MIVNKIEDEEMENIFKRNEACFDSKVSRFRYEIFSKKKKEERGEAHLVFSFGGKLLRCWCDHPPKKKFATTKDVRIILRVESLPQGGAKCLP